MRIVPVADRIVRDPETRRPIGAEGLMVDPGNFYWARLLADGDVEAAPDEPAPDAAPAAAPEEPAHG